MFVARILSQNIKITSTETNERKANPALRGFGLPGRLIWNAFGPIVENQTG